MAFLRQSSTRISNTFWKCEILLGYCLLNDYQMSVKIFALDSICESHRVDIKAEVSNPINISTPNWLFVTANSPLIQLSWKTQRFYCEHPLFAKVQSEALVIFLSFSVHRDVDVTEHQKPSLRSIKSFMWRNQVIKNMITNHFSISLCPVRQLTSWLSPERCHAIRSGKHNVCITSINVSCSRRSEVD